MTMGRSIRIGCLAIASIRSSSDKDKLSSLFSVYVVSCLRIRLRGVNLNSSIISLSFFEDGDVLRYSMMVGLIPCLLSSSNVWRDLLHFGLW